MKLMFASDIHGSALFCEKLLEAYRREGAERLCLIGDVLYHGPRNDLPEGHAPKKVIALLNAVKERLPRYLLFKTLPCPEIEIARLGPDAGIIGAASLGR